MTEVKDVSNSNSKNDKITMVVIGVIIIFSVIYFIWDNFMGIQPDIKINDTQISMRNTVKDLLDNGFVLCDSQGSIRNNLDFDLTGKQIYNTDYYIGIPYESGGTFCKCSGVAITVANFGASSDSFKNGAIYQMTYYQGFQDTGVKVLINGEDLSDASFDDWIKFFDKASYPFKKNDLEKFSRGDSSFLLEKKGRYKFDVESKDEYNEEKGDWSNRSIFSITFTRNINIEYKSK